MTGKEARQLKAGQRVFWNDPDDGACSGYWLIHRIQVDTGRDPVVRIEKRSGAYLEAYASELSPVAGEDNA